MKCKITDESHYRDKRLLIVNEGGEFFLAGAGLKEYTKYKIVIQSGKDMRVTTGRITKMDDDGFPELAEIIEREMKNHNNTWSVIMEDEY